MRAYRVGADQVDGVHAILAECGRDLSDRLGLRHWDSPYPIDAMRADAATREVYAVEQDGIEIATYTLGTTPLPSYPPTLWTPNTDPALYLNRLAVRPTRQGRGVGCWCLGEIESRARTLACRAVRFDAIPSLRAFYEALGYHDCGPFQIGSVPVVCFEKVLT